MITQGPIVGLPYTPFITHPYLPFVEEKVSIPSGEIPYNILPTGEKQYLPAIIEKPVEPVGPVRVVKTIVAAPTLKIEKTREKKKFPYVKVAIGIFALIGIINLVKRRQ